MVFRLGVAGIKFLQHVLVPAAWCRHPLVHYRTNGPLLAHDSTFLHAPHGKPLSHPILLLQYMVCVFAIGCLSIIAGLLGFVLKLQVGVFAVVAEERKAFCLQLEQEEVRAWMTAGLLHEYGHPSAGEVTEAWDLLQQKVSFFSLEMTC